MIVSERRYWRWCAIGCLGAVIATMLAACSVAAREADSGASETQPVPVDRRREVLDRERAAPSPQRAPQAQSPQEPETLGPGEVPERLLAIFKEDLARRALVKPEAISVKSAAQVQWPDGSLGCPRPGQFYTQVITPGYRVILSAAGRSYAYHSDMRGLFVVCSDGVPSSPVTDQTRASPAQ